RTVGDGLLERPAEAEHGDTAVHPGDVQPDHGPAHGRVERVVAGAVGPDPGTGRHRRHHVGDRTQLRVLLHVVQLWTRTVHRSTRAQGDVEGRGHLHDRGELVPGGCRTD